MTQCAERPDLQQSYIIQGSRVVQSGAGFPVILIHGVAMDLTMWDEIERCLCPQFTIVRYDTIGHGPGDHPSGPYTIRQYAEQLNHITTCLGLDNFIIVGFSMGGLIAEEFTLCYPEKVAGLVVLSSVFARSTAERSAVMNRVREAEQATEFVGLTAGIERWFTPEFRADNAPTVERVVAQMKKNNLKSFAAAYRVFATADAQILPRIGEIYCPVLSVTGEFDQRSTPAMAKQLAASVQSGESIILQGQQHLIPIEKPQQVSEIIVNFVNRISFKLKM